MPARRATSDQHELVSPSRRRALKAAAATGTAALVWTEPTIKGLARRPAYAGASSTENLTFSIPPLTAQQIATYVSPEGVSFQLGGSPFPTTNTVTPVVAGCVCTFDIPMSGVFTISNGFGGSAVNGSVTAAHIEWDPGIDAGPMPTLTTTVTLTGTCVPNP